MHALSAFTFARHASQSSAPTSGVKIALINGDGHGGELIQACKRVLSALLPEAPEFVELQAGYEVYKKTGNALPTETVDALKSGKYHAALFGCVASPLTGQDKSYISPVVAIRQKLGLFAHVQTNVLKSKGVDITVVREATECLFVAKEHMKTPDIAVAERVISRKACEDIAHFAFKEAALAYDRRVAAASLEAMKQRETGGAHLTSEEVKKSVRKPSLTFAHKANILPVTDGLMRSIVYEISKQYTNVQVKELLIDMAIYRLYLSPTEFDVILACNTYGDILDDACAAITGGLGVAPVACLNDKFIFAHGADVVHQPMVNSAYVNPVGHIRSVGMVLHRLGYANEALWLEQAVLTTLYEKRIRTPDFENGKQYTSEVVDAIIDQSLFNSYKYGTAGERS